MIRRAMTLVEMLVALAMTLLLMTAIAQMFSAFGSSISDSRAVLELDGRLRTVAWRLRTDLAGVTAPTLPPLGPDSGQGYFEIIEGPAADGDAASGLLVSPADFDDAILFTTRSSDTPFIGRAPALGGTSITDQVDLFESTLAEVAWFARKTPGSANPETYTLYRRQLLVMGYVGSPPFSSPPGGNNTLPWAVGGGSWAGFFDLPCDISVRREGATLYPNTLADLTRRECRFMHNPNGVVGAGGFPFPFVDHQTDPAPNGLVFDAPSPRQGEDVVLNNVIAFDVRVFDAGAPVFVTAGNTALVPGDPGFAAAASAAASPSASGGYVDLGHRFFRNALLTGIVSSGSAAKFGGFGQPRSGLVGTGTTRRTYDTWSRHYEANGLDEDGDGVRDEGTDGIDNDNDGSFDEPAYDADGDGVFENLGESETLPPYPVPLRGVEVRIRCYEPASRQVRQVTVRHTFVPH